MIHANAMAPARTNVVICAHTADEAWTRRLTVQLAVYRDRLDLWDERRLTTAPGEEAALVEALASASAVVLLLSPAWLNSRFAAGGELQHALDVGDIVLPVRVEPCDLSAATWLTRCVVRPPEPALSSPSARTHAVEAALRDVARECGARLRAAAWSRPVLASDARAGTPAPPIARTQPGGERVEAALHTQRHALVALLRTRALARPTPSASAHVDLLKVLRARAGQAPRPTLTMHKAPHQPRRRAELDGVRDVTAPAARPRHARRFVQVALLLAVAYVAYRWHTDALPNVLNAPRVSVPALAVPPVPEGTMERRYVAESLRLDAGGRVWLRTTHEVPAFSESLADGVILELVPLRGGTFAMGSPVTEASRFADEGPQHRVTIGPFAIGKFEVTQAQWAAVAALPRITHELAPRPSAFSGDNRPVESISWHEAVEFCARLAHHTGRPYRLPSEAEWEFAARAGSQTPWAWGDASSPALAHSASAAKGLLSKILQSSPEATTDVGGARYANAFGLYDTHGNVWEWTLDTWHDTYAGAPTDGSAWTTDGDSSRRVRRGGSWEDRPWACRSAMRNHSLVDSTNDAVGFRVALSLAVSRAKP
jgi:formylglycine-generating enzyme required for sulfatase activity